MSKRNLLLAGLVGGVIAAAGNFAVYFLGRAAAVDFVGRFRGGIVGPLPPVAIAISSVLPGVVAGLVVLGMGLFMSRPLRFFVPVASVLALVSMVPPMNIADASLGTRISLALMHVVAAAAIIGAIVHRWRRDESSSIKPRSAS